MSSPESGSGNASPEPAEPYRLVNATGITCFPVIKTADDDERKSPPTQKTTTGGSTNFSISSILSRSEPTGKRNGLLAGLPNVGQNVLDVGAGGNSDTAMLSR